VGIVSARTVWLASYPKSGNTWVRAIVTALGTHPELFGVDHLSSGSQPHHVGAALGAYGLDARWLTDDENLGVRSALTQRFALSDDSGAPLLRKTHEIYRADTSGRAPFPADATRAAILVVRDPRDVACSAAAFFGTTIDEAIDAMSTDGGEPVPNAARSQTAQPWGTWSSHACSWLGEDVPFPVHVVRFEDLVSDAVATLHPVFTAIGIDCSHEELELAVEQARFDRLQESEADRGFRGTHPNTEQFFRRGVDGGWRDELTDAQAATIEDEHAELMARLGYSPSVTIDASDWRWLPPSLGISVREGRLPDSLPGAEQPRPWIEVTPSSALLRFRGRAGLLVENGTDVVVDRGVSGADDVGWMVQGWAVTLAMLQRGMLSLHASTVLVGDLVVAVAGARGAGKSTTAMGLRSRGHALLCDDVTLVEFRDGGAWTTPYSRNVHLLEDAAAAVGVDFDSLAPLGRGRVKVAFRAETPSAEPRRIDGIVVLTSTDEQAVTVRHVSGAERMAALLAHTTRDGIAPIVLGQERYFAQVAQLADIVPITLVERPRDTWTLDAVLDAIEADS
jgi:aryl sulfotransferase